ncbi:MAG: hypothetical protein U0361_25040, partial [Nitrospiraceae bacterium]
DQNVRKQTARTEFRDSIIPSGTAVLQLEADSSRRWYTELVELGKFRMTSEVVPRPDWAWRSRMDLRCIFRRCLNNSFSLLRTTIHANPAGLLSAPLPNSACRD